MFVFVPVLDHNKIFISLKLEFGLGAKRQYFVWGSPLHSFLSSPAATESISVCLFAADRRISFVVATSGRGLAHFVVR